MRWKLTLPVASIASALLFAGCGLDVTIMGPSQATSGETIAYQIKLTNVSVCPVAADSGFESFAFLPLVPASVINSSPILQEFCLDPGITAVSANLAEPGTFPVSAARSLLLSAAGGAAPATCTGAGFTCQSIPPQSMLPSGGAFCVVMGDFAPGEMRTVTCEVEAMGSGPAFNIAGSMLEATGVCKAGPGQGQPCDEDLDCGVGGDCGDGICEMGSNAGNGCDNAGECPMGTCTDCSDSDGLGVDCTETRVVGVARAPIASPMGLAAIAAGLCAIAAFRLSRSRARRRP